MSCERTGPRFAQLFAALLFVVAQVACASCSDRKPPPEATKRKANPVVELTIDTGKEKLQVSVEVVVSPKLREKGLMYREELVDGQGMLFVFQAEEERSFWMKNCSIALDMIFVNDRMRIVNIQHMAEPGSTRSKPSTGPARYVLEIRGGEARSRGLSAGDRVVFRPVASSGSR